uniref:SET domain-containing protein n=1 Tax=Mantoniella antarctica TaxID=81844 RepID=A0A7S0T1J1_9CHLO|mmetsp:Transcript_6054/g.15019  ORF Transcript_6054/g.15019 Transcript_6054/m.15019 type:complete len:371 (+) Transcript_6054:95-1207(+)
MHGVGVSARTLGSAASAITTARRTPAGMAAPPRSASQSCRTMATGASDWPAEARSALSSQSTAPMGTADGGVVGASTASSADIQKAESSKNREGKNVAETFFTEGGLKKMAPSDGEQAALLAAVAKHLAVLKEMPDFLPYLHVDAGAVRVAPSRVCDGRGVFATRAIKAHTLVTLYPASNELSLCADRARGHVSVWRPETYSAPHADYAMFNGHPYFADNALRLEADGGAGDDAAQDGFLGHLINDAAMPPTDAADIAYAQEYLRRTTNDTNCHAVPFPSGMVAVAASKDIADGEELLMTYTFGFNQEFMEDMAAKPELRKKMLTNSFAADMKVASVKMEQLTAESLNVHSEVELLCRELLCDAAEEGDN